MKTSRTMRACAIVACAALAANAGGAVEVYFGDDGRAAWESDVGTWNEMDFTGFEPGLNPTFEYLESVGAVFVDGFNSIEGEFFTLYPEDGWGIVSGGPGSVIEFELIAPTRSLAMLFPGGINVTLWSGDEVVAQTGGGSPGNGNFLGLLSTVPFDRVRLDASGSIAFVDDIRVGVLIPGPGAAALMAVASVIGTGRGRARR